MQLSILPSRADRARLEPYETEDYRHLTREDMPVECGHTENVLMLSEKSKLR